MNKFLILINVIIFTIHNLSAQNDKWQIFTNTEIGILYSSITCIIEDKQYNIWVGTNGEGIFKYDGNTWIKFDTTNSPLLSNYVTSIAVDSNNYIWIATFGNKGGLTKYDGYSWKIYNIKGNSTYNIQIDKNGTFWMGSYWEGLIKFDGDTSFTYYSSNNTNLYPTRDEIISVNTQLENIILCGTDLGGAAAFNITTSNWIEYFPPVFPIDLVINSIIVDANKSIWFAGIQYISMMDSSGSWQVFDYNYTNNYDFYHDIVLEDNNCLLFSSDNGLLELDYSNGEVWKNIKPPYAVIDSLGCDGLTKDHSGNLLIGFNNGYLAVYNPYGISDLKGCKSPIEKFFILSQNFPNPFNPITKIQYTISKSGFVSLIIYDMLGKEIVTLVKDHKNIGNYEVEFNTTNLPSGVYFYRMISGNYSETKKMLLLR